MKKKFLGIALIAMLAAFPAVANDNAAKDNSKKEAACCTKTECGKDGKQAVNPFEGLNLTEAQKTKLAELRKNRCEQAKANKEQANGEKQKAAAEKRETRRNDKRGFLKEVKAILTPEQYVQFLENEFVKQNPRQHDRKGQMNGKRDGKNQGKHDGKNRGQRPERAPRQQQAPAQSK